MIFGRKNWDRLNKMLDEGIRGDFQETHYDESELSKLEVKWKQFLAASSLSRNNLEQEKDNIKSMISDISHQTKTPIANIKLYAELLEERLKETGDEAEQAMARQIRKQTATLEFLIRSLTKMSRLESNILTVQPVQQAVLPLMEAAMAEILPKAVQKGITIQMNCPEDFFMCYDKKWTVEALSNLLDNAVKYSSEGTTVFFTGREYEIYGSVCVRDEGPGIPEAELPRIFERFYRGSDMQQEEGVGIGLYLAREIARKQNGYIKVKSFVGRGSTFAMYLPKNI